MASFVSNLEIKNNRAIPKVYYTLKLKSYSLASSQSDLNWPKFSANTTYVCLLGKHFRGSKWFLLLLGRRLIWLSDTMMTSSNGNIFGVTGLLCGEFTGHRWIPLTMASDAELWYFLWSAPERSRHRWFETPSRSLWRYCNAIIIFAAGIRCQHNHLRLFKETLNTPWIWIDTDEGLDLGIKVTYLPSVLKGLNCISTSWTWL